MIRKLYSDPYLKALIESEPELAQEFLESLANSEFVTQDDLVLCLELPGWVVEKAGVAGCKNPNFPATAFEELISNPEILSKEYWSIFKYPNMTKEHIQKLMKSEDPNVRGLALAHPFGDSAQLLNYLQDFISTNDYTTYVIIDICQRIELSDELFNYLFTVNSFERGGRSIGQVLWNNPSLSEEQKTLLVLSDVEPKVEDSFWGDIYRLQFVSSIPYFQSLRATFGSYEGQKFQTIPALNPEIEDFFTKSGHPLSVLLPIQPESKIDVSYLGLADLINKEFMPRLFWTDLCEREDFEIYRRNGYRIDDLFISHPILGREFAEADTEQATRLGGVFIFNDQNWLSGEAELAPEQAAHELQAYEESLVTIVENTENYEELGQTLIALTFELPNLPAKYGFELTESAEEWMIDAALESAEADSFDVSATLNSYFGEMLSWRKLPDSKKDTIFEFLSLGFGLEHSKLRNDSIHFLGCMALHEDTPNSILEKLAKLDDSLIKEVLASRG